MESKKITIQTWHEMALQGVRLPMRIPINGVSMYPLIRRNRDMVTLMPVEAPLQRGDIVMFADPARDRYVLHRVWQLEQDRVLTWGDNCDGPDGWMPPEMVWGKAMLIERGKRSITPDPAKGLKLASRWHTVGKVLRRVKGLAYGAARRAKRIVTRQKSK